jgi:hypothetical protein
MSTSTLPDKSTAKAAEIKTRQETVESLISIVTKHAAEHMLAVGTRLIGALLDPTDMTSIDPRIVYSRIKAGKLLKDNNYAFFRLQATVLERLVRKEFKALSPLAVVLKVQVGSLELVPFEEMDNKVAFDALSRPFEMRYADLLATLNIRIGHLLDREVLRNNQNPFRPEMFLAALQQAWCEFDPDTESHALIPTMLTPDVLFDFTPMYEALNDVMKRKGSGDVLNIKKTESKNAAKAARAKEKERLTKQLRKFLAGEPDDDNEFDVPLIPDLPGMPTGNGSWRPSGALVGAAPSSALADSPLPGATPGSGVMHGHGNGGTPAFVHGGPVRTTQMAPGHYPGHYNGGAPLAQAPLFSMLADIQHSAPLPATGALVDANQLHALPTLKERIPQGSMSRGDESTLDLLSKIFDTVFHDESIPKEIRALIQYLQIPVLKAALVDKEFFYEEAHPARRMIDLLSRMGMEQRKGADDPVMHAMRASVDKVGRDFERGEHVFAEAVAELESTIKKEEIVAEEAIAQPIAAAIKQERVVAATRSAKSAVAVRVSSGEVITVLETFLEKKWTSVLTVAYSVEDNKPGAVNNATKTMDELIWSVKPKLTFATRKELINKLPGLLAQLNKWLDVIQWKDAERLQFFAELAECHASIVRAPVDLSPARQLEIAVEVAQQDAVRRIKKEEEVAEAPEIVVDDALLAVESLERGMLVDFTQSDNSVRRVKLAWISPLRTLFIFSTVQRQEAFSFPAEKMVEACRAGKIAVVNADGTVSRALSKAMGANDDESEQLLSA